MVMGVIYDFDGDLSLGPRPVIMTLHQGEEPTTMVATPYNLIIGRPEPAPTFTTKTKQKKKPETRQPHENIVQT